MEGGWEQALKECVYKRCGILQKKWNVEDY